MKLGTLRLSRETLVEAGTPDEVAAKRAELVREKRIEHARATRDWVEHREEEFVRRPPGFLVHADSDQVFTVYRGTVFEPRGARIVFGHVPEMHWFIDRAGEIVFLERTSPRTWSEHVERQARRDAARR
jgi:hypothetical protein